MESQYKFLSINKWPENERPREKLLRSGEHKLSDTELLAILLGKGSRGCTALDLARRILHKYPGFRKISGADISDYKEFKGLGGAKIAQVKAAIEIGRRFGEERIKKSSKIESSKDAVRILMPRMRDLSKEVFKIIVLNSQGILIDIIEIAEGSVNQVRPLMREIFRKAIQIFAVSIICVHNHPAGNPKPSKEDKSFTRELFLAGQILGIYVLDHVIIGNNNYFSFADRGMIK